MFAKRVVQEIIHEEKENKPPEFIAALCNAIVDDFQDYCKTEEFYSLHFPTIYSIFQRTKGINIETLSFFLSKMSLKYQETPQLLNLVNFHRSSLLDCVTIIRSLKSCPICVRLGELYEEEQELVERDWEYELKEKDKQITTLKEDISKLKQKISSKSGEDSKKTIQVSASKGGKPSDFEPNIHIACNLGKFSSVCFLISEQPENIEKKESNGNTPLICASTGGKLEIVQYLIENGANIDAKNNNVIPSKTTEMERQH